MLSLKSPRLLLKPKWTLELLSKFIDHRRNGRIHGGNASTSFFWHLPDRTSTGQDRFRERLPTRQHWKANSLGAESQREVSFVSETLSKLNSAFAISLCVLGGKMTPSPTVNLILRYLRLTRPVTFAIELRETSGWVGLFAWLTSRSC